MPFCPNCGTDNQGNFCANCGTQIGTAQAAGSPPPPAAAAGGLEENVASALCYLLGLLTGVLFLVLAPYNQNRTIRFHAFQAIFFGLATFVGFIIITILGFIPFVGWIFSIGLGLIYPLLLVVLWLMLMFKAYNREKWVLPIIGPMAEKQAYSS